MKKILARLYSINIIRKSEYFDKEWYNKEYSDINGLFRLFPYIHYALFGWKENRNPSEAFNTDYYLNAYEDVKNAGINPLYHYERVGKNENRCINGAAHVYNLINTSLYFNNDWYITNYMMHSKGHAPVIDYLKYKSLKNPSPIFYSKEYLYLNPDVAMHDVNPLVHYLTNGQFENRFISLTELKEYNAPKGTVSIEKDFFARKSNDKKLVTVLASFSASGKIEDFQIYLLKGLHKISDYIVIVSDNPLYEEELTKIDEICNHCIFIRHGEYDFGSYKYGYNYLIENKILEHDDNLLFINDSNYGPVYPFENVIDDFKSKQCDFYGLSVGRNEFHTSIQSFFYIFKSHVYTDPIFDTFIKSVKKEISAAYVVCNYEFSLTKILVNNGFKYKTFIPENFMIEKKSVIPTKYSYTLMNDFKYPLIKRKALQGSTIESVDDIIDHIKISNKELYDIIMERENLDNYNQEKFTDIPSKYLLLSNYAKKEQEIREKIKNNEKINVIFFAYSAETFAAEHVMKQMMKDSIYNVKLYIIPDLRLDEHEAVIKYEETYDLLSTKYPFALKTCDIGIKLKSQQEYNQEEDFKKENKLLTKKAKRDMKNINGILYYEENCFVNHKNVMADSDIIFFPNIQDISFSLYNPYYAVRLNILSVYIPHEIYPFKFDRNYYRMDNFNNFWKVFLDSQISFDEYKQYGQCQAINAVVSGLNCDYFECTESSQNNGRKTIIVAPFFSIHNGTKMLNSFALENYGKLLFNLPEKYTNIDFIYLFSNAIENLLLNTENENIKEIESYKNKLNNYDNAFIYGEQDYKNILSSSNGIILDCSPLFVDTVLLNIPCLYITKNNIMEKKKFNKIGYHMYNAVYKAETEDEINTFIDNVIIRMDDTSQGNNKNLLKNLFISNEDIVDFLNKLWER